MLEYKVHRYWLLIKIWWLMKWDYYYLYIFKNVMCRHKSVTLKTEKVEYLPTRQSIHYDDYYEKWNIILTFIVVEIMKEKNENG